MTVATARTGSSSSSAIAGESTGAIVPSLAGIGADELALAYAECRRITRARARNFYYGLRLTPEPRRSAIYAIYAWMRGADDEADCEGPATERQRRLGAYRELTRRAIEEGRREGAVKWGELPPHWPAFAATAHSYPLDHGLFSEMLDGLEEDLEHGGYATDAALARYCHRVASTVGLACIAVWGLRAGADVDEARRLAERRGQAFQRTNILRDFAEDFDGSPRRVYLPREAFLRWGVTPEDVRHWRNPEACGRLIGEAAAIARTEYEASEPLVGMIAPDCSPTLWAMTRIYSEILGLIERDPARIVAPGRIRLPASRKALIALRATMRAKRSGW